MKPKRSHPTPPWPTLGFPPWSMACLTRTLTQGTGAPALQRLLDAVQMPNPITASCARDHQPLERLALKRYVVLQDKP